MRKSKKCFSKKHFSKLTRNQTAAPFFGWLQLIMFIQFFLCPQLVSAQAMAVAHDESLMQQFLMSQTGVGNLTPDAYYSAFHHSYRQSAYALGGHAEYRSHAALALYPQVAYADSIDSVMVKRARVEAFNVADRQIDLAWTAERSKIERYLGYFKENINYIMLKGGTREDKESWEEIYQSIEDGLSAVRSAYLSNSKRKEQYLTIYADLKKRNYHLLLYLQKLDMAKRAKDMETSQPLARVDHVNIAREAMGRWKFVLSNVCQSNFNRDMRNRDTNFDEDDEPLW